MGGGGNEKGRMQISHLAKNMIMKRILSALTPFSITNHIFVYRKNMVFNILQPPPEDYLFSFPADISFLTDSMLEPVSLNISKLQSALAQGQRLAIVTAPDGTVAHRTIVQSNSGPVVLDGDRCHFVLQEDQSYIHYCETAPSHRGYGLYPFVLNRIIQHLREETEFLEVWIACLTTNYASSRGILKSGFAYENSVRIWGILNGRIRFRRKYMDPEMRHVQLVQNPII